MTRAQQAVFLLKAKFGPRPTSLLRRQEPFSPTSRPPPSRPRGSKRSPPRESPAAAAGTISVPTPPFPRAQMAVLLLKTSHGYEYVPPPATGIFHDVPPGSFAAAWIEQLYNEGITAGCTGGATIVPTPPHPGNRWRRFWSRLSTSPRPAHRPADRRTASQPPLARPLRLGLVDSPSPLTYSYAPSHGASSRLAAARVTLRDCL